MSESECVADIRKYFDKRNFESKFSVTGTKDIGEFFREFESCCKLKHPENKNYWVKELEASLEGPVLEFYHIITSVGEPKYETVRDTIMYQVK